MKRLCAALCCFYTFVVVQGAAAQNEVKTTKLCTTCVPKVAIFTDSSHGTLYTTPDLFGFNAATVYKTHDGGGSWSELTEGGTIYTNNDVVRAISFLDASTIYWKTSQDLFFTVDSGKSWDFVHMFPVPKFLRMFDRENGIGLTETKNQNQEYEIMSVRSSDGGAYWETTLGQSYARKSRLADALFLDDSTFLLVHAGNAGEIMRTTDGGLNWSTVFQLTESDSVYLSRMHAIPNSDIVYLESYKNAPLILSLDKGNSWTLLPKVNGFYIYRTRAVIVDNSLHLWAAAGSVLGNAADDLLNPPFPDAYAYKLVHSTDTGKTWKVVEIKSVNSGAKIFDIVPIGNRVHVFFFEDSNTVLTTLELDDFSSVNSSDISKSPNLTLYPNPSNRHATIYVGSPETAYDRIEVWDAASHLVHSEMVYPDNSSYIPINIELPSGAYTVIFLNGHVRSGTSRFVVR